MTLSRPYTALHYYNTPHDAATDTMRVLYQKNPSSLLMTASHAEILIEAKRREAPVRFAPRPFNACPVFTVCVFGRHARGVGRGIGLARRAVERAVRERQDLEVAGVSGA